MEKNKNEIAPKNINQEQLISTIVSKDKFTTIVGNTKIVVNNNGISIQVL